mgnify:CR=1 FL=1
MQNPTNVIPPVGTIVQTRWFTRDGKQQTGVVCNSSFDPVLGTMVDVLFEDYEQTLRRMPLQDIEVPSALRGLNAVLRMPRIPTPWPRKPCVEAMRNVEPGTWCIDLSDMPSIDDTSQVVMYFAPGVSPDCVNVLTWHNRHRVWTIRTRDRAQLNVFDIPRALQPVRVGQRLGDYKRLKSHAIYSDQSGTWTCIHPFEVTKKTVAQDRLVLVTMRIDVGTRIYTNGLRVYREGHIGASACRVSGAYIVAQQYVDNGEQVMASHSLANDSFLYYTHYRTISLFGERRTLDAPGIHCFINPEDTDAFQRTIL